MWPAVMTNGRSGAVARYAELFANGLGAIRPIPDYTSRRITATFSFLPIFSYYNDAVCPRDLRERRKVRGVFSFQEHIRHNAKLLNRNWRYIRLWDCKLNNY